MVVINGVASPTADPCQQGEEAPYTDFTWPANRGDVAVLGLAGATTGQENATGA